MRGSWYGIGVGPGDPELMTVKAVRILRECQTVAIPHGSKEQCVAYQIALQAVPELRDKKCICLPMPMTKNRELLEKSHADAAERTAECLDRGESVAFITLGDSTVYSTCLYIKERLDAKQYETQLVNGIPSFCACAARLGIPLVNGKEELHIIPASYRAEEALALPGVTVLMKAGKKLPEIKRLLKETGASVHMVENCGMKEERIYRDVESIPDDTGYYSLFIVRHDREK